jgi:hypothetical protein
MEHALDQFLAKEDRYAYEDGEADPPQGWRQCHICGHYKPSLEMADAKVCKRCDGAVRTDWCPECKRTTVQKYWANRGGWICEDGGEGCAGLILSDAEREERDRRLAGLTADMIWRK